MKVRLVYVVGFRGSEEWQETQDCVKALTLKYEQKGASVNACFITTGTDNPSFMTMQKNKTPKDKAPGMHEFGAFRGTDTTDYAPLVKGNFGVGVYFVFHGRAEKANVQVGVVAQITTWLMDKHPGGQLRKVVFLACGYAGLDRGRTSLLEKFANALESRNTHRRQDLPKLAGWSNFVSVHKDGSKIAASPGDRSNYKWATELVSTCKTVFVLGQGGSYEKRWLNGPSDPLWHDPEVVSTSSGNVLVPQDGLDPRLPLGHAFL